jgi:hypothetical protein
MNFKSAKILSILITSGLLLIGCSGGSDNAIPSGATTPVFNSALVADDILDGNFTTSTVVYDATANNDVNITYTLTSGVANNDLFNITSDGNVTFKALPVVSGAHNDYNLTITATDTANNHTDHNVTLRVMNDVIDLGTYGLLIAPIHVGGKWFYVWDMNGDGIHDYNKNSNGKYDYDGQIVNALGSGHQYDYTTNDILDTLFNHDARSSTNTTVANIDGHFGTTNDYRYGTINGIKLALPTTGTGLATEVSVWYSLSDNQTSYTDLASVWDAYNTGVSTSGTPAGWQADYYNSATPSTDGHAYVGIIEGSVNHGESSVDTRSAYVALQVL